MWLVDDRLVVEVTFTISAGICGLQEERNMSSAEIAERISALKLELQDYSQKIVTHVEVLNAPNVSKIPLDFKNDPRNAVRVLRADVLELLETTQSKASEFSAESKEELDECSSLVDILVKIVALTDAMSACDVALAGSDIMKSVSLLEDMELKLTELPSASSEYGSGMLCRLLRREVNIIRGRFLARLRRLFNECVTIECGRIYIAKQLEGMVRGEDALIDSPIKLYDICAALEALDALQEVVDVLCLSMWKDMLKPLWKEKKMVGCKIFSDQDRAEIVYENVIREDLTSTTLKQDTGDKRPSPWLAASDDATFAAPGPSKAPFAQLLEQVGVSLHFLYNELLSCNPQLARLTASGLSTKVQLMSHLVNTVILVMPKLESELSVFQKPFEKSFKDFESKLNSCGVFGEVLLSNTSLKELVANIPGQFAIVRRRDTLVRARELILADYHNTMLGSGSALDDDPASAGCVGDSRAIIEQSGSFMQSLRFESCQISLAACRVLRLMHEVLQQATQSKEKRLVHSLYHSARECLELFIAIVPIRFSETIKSSPKMAAVFFNDCAYIAHNCTIIANMYRDEIGKVHPDLRETLGFLDFIPRFRSAGEKELVVHVENCKKKLYDLIDTQIKINPDVQDTRGGYNDEGGVSAVIKVFEICAEQWQDVLQDVVYERSMGHLLECTVRAMMKPVLEADTIAVSSGSEICRIFGSLQRVKAVFGSPAPEHEQMIKFAGSWNKFVVLTDLMEYSLSEISEMLSASKFSSFTETEMTNLIKALFEDSDKRKGVLSAILDSQMASKQKL